jgi:hypothetical protein
MLSNVPTLPLATVVAIGENRRQTKHEKSKQKIVFFTILDILTEFKIPYQAICQTEGTHFQSFGQITGNFRQLAK